MTQEEKAKAYDEAYKVAESIHRFSSNPVEIKRMEQIFHELKESKDEKIRKWLISYFSKINEEVVEADRQKIIVYLEKQGEQKSNCGIPDATKQELKDNLNKALQKETGESWNEFLDEQKPTDKVEPKFKEE